MSLLSVYRLFLPFTKLTVLATLFKPFSFFHCYVSIDGRVLIMVGITTIFCCVTHNLSLMSLYAFLFYLFSRGAGAAVQLHDNHMRPVLPELHVPLPVQHRVPHLCLRAAFPHVEKHRTHH